MKTSPPVFAEKLVLPLGPLKGVTCVTGHCINRFIERTGTKGTVAQILLKLENWISQARPGELVPGAEFHKIIKHGKLATYLLFGNLGKGQQWVLVITNGCLVTIHDGKAGHWRPKS